MESILNNIGQIQNGRQAKYMNDIKNIGMGILFGQVDASVYSKTFEKYIDYIDQPSQYLETLKKVSQKIENNECTPDDLLIEMCKHTLQIQYNDDEYEYEYECDDEYEDDDTEIILDSEQTEVLENILKQIFGMR